MPFPQLSISGISNAQAAYFSGAVSVYPGIEATVNATGYTTPIIDTGFGGPPRGLNVVVDVSSLGQNTAVRFYIQTSKDGASWQLNATHETGTVVAPGEYLIHFATEHRYFRLWWTGADVNSSPQPPLTAFLQPVADLMPLQWAVAGAATHSGAMAKGVFGATPTAAPLAPPGLSSYISADVSIQFSKDTYSLTAPPSIGSNVSAITVWTYWGYITSNSNLEVSLTQSGILLPFQLMPLPAGGAPDWTSTTFTPAGGFSQADLNALQLQIYTGPVSEGQVDTVYAAYAAFNYGQADNYPAGNYRLAYVDGAYQYDTAQAKPWVVGTVVTTGAVTEGLAAASQIGPPYPAPQGSEIAAENYWAGYGLVFTHAGGPIGIYNSDSNQANNADGSPQTTWQLETEGQVTFTWRISIADTG